MECSGQKNYGPKKTHEYTYLQSRLRAASHLVTGRVTSVEKVSDLQLVVRSQGETKTVDLGDPEEKDGLFYYRFGHQAAPHEEVVLEPKASRHLISPSRLHLLVADDCQLEAAIFTATPGLFVTGDFFATISCGIVVAI